jgi:HD superfamily phosphohydrolase
MKHQQEIQKILGEKEVALAEETQATIQALDAMKKAHQNEVKKEIQRFKQDFIRKFNNQDTMDTVSHYKDKELEEVRQEILSLSEKYSLKCVEIISLEEKLKVTEQKLKLMEQTYGSSMTPIRSIRPKPFEGIYH